MPALPGAPGVSSPRALACSTLLVLVTLATGPVAFAGTFSSAGTDSGGTPRDPLLLLASGSPGTETWSGQAPAGAPTLPERGVFRRAYVPITLGEVSLLAVTAMLPRDWTGWSPDFVQDGLGNLGEAWTRPPVMDDDHWFHNYVGHPYGGSFYYNAVRSQGATPGQSIAFATLLSMQWEYVFEAVAERPSIQDIVITPVAGAVFGELTHRMAVRMQERGATFPQKVLLTVLNPAHVLWRGYPPSPAEARLRSVPSEPYSEP